MRSRLLHSNDAWKVNIEAGSRAILIGPFVCEAIMDTANGGSGASPPKDRELTPEELADHEARLQAAGVTLVQPKDSSELEKLCRPYIPSEAEKKATAKTKANELPKPMVEYALEYQRAGFAVLPVKPGSKNPGGRLPRDLDANGEEIPNTGGVKKASKDPEDIKRWWARWPNDNIGLALGRASGGIVAYDNDSQSQRDVLAAAGLTDFHSTLETKSGNADGDHGHSFYRATSGRRDAQPRIRRRWYPGGQLHRCRGPVDAQRRQPLHANSQRVS